MYVHIIIDDGNIITKNISFFLFFWGGGLRRIMFGFEWVF